MKSQSLPKFIIRWPEEIRDFVADQAARNAASMNSEVIRAVRERMDRVAASEAKRKAAGHRA